MYQRGNQGCERSQYPRFKEYRVHFLEVKQMASQECQYCYYWKGNHTTTKADCDKTGKYKRYDDECDCGKYAKR